MFWRKSIGRKLGLGFAAIILLFSIKTFYTIHSLDQLFLFTEKIYEHPFTVINAVLKIEADIALIHRVMMKVVMSSDQDVIKENLKLMNRCETDAISNFKIISERFLGERYKYENAYQLFHHWKHARDQAISKTDQGLLKQSSTAILTEDSHNMEKIQQALNEILNFAENKAAMLYAEAHQKKQKTILTAYAVLGSIIFLSIIFGFYFVRTTTLPIIKLKEAARKISEGNLDIRVCIDRMDEVGHLAAYFVKMTDSLKSMIRIEQERVRELRESEAKYRRLVDGMPAILYVFSDKRGGVYYSRHVESVLGYSVQHLSENPFLWQKSIHPEDISKIAKTVKGLESNNTFEIEYRIRTESGEWKWFLDRSIGIETQEGETIVEGLAMDITERKHIEEALRASETELRTLVNAIPDMVWLKNENGVYLKCNHQFEKFVGKAEKDIVGKTDYDLVDKALADFFREKDKSAIIAGKPTINEEQITFASDGQIEFLETIKTPIYGSDGQVIGVLGIGRNITKRKQMSEKLRESEAKFRNLIEKTPIPMCFVNNREELEYFNPRFIKLFGYDRTDVPTLSEWWLLAYPDETYRQWVLETWNKAVAKSADNCTDIEPIEYRVTCKDGNIRNVEIGGIVLENGFLATFIDATERKRAEEALCRAKESADVANRAKTEFLATMSHEIRTPMNAILGFTELLEKLITEPRQKSYLNAIQSGGKTLLRLINDILDLAKIESGKIALQYESVNFHKFLDEVVQIFAQKIKQKKLEMIFEFEHALPSFLIIDELRLRQILFNLLGNAIKFTDNGYIRLTAAAVSDTYDGNFIDLCITVEDSGIGIPAEQRERIFEPFNKFEPKGLRKYEGTGLGLSISRRLCEIMGGELRLSSEEGSGSVFTLILPKVEITSSADILKRNEFEPIPDISTLAGIIMIVDDVDSNRQLIKESFRGTMLTVTEAENGLAALEKIRQEKPDLILMDLKMPVMDGFEACRRIKADPDLKSIPVVAITASSLETRERLHYFDGYLRKPVSLSDLYKEMNCHLNVFKDTKTFSPTKTEDALIENAENSDQIISALIDSFLPRMESFKKRQPIKEVKQFGNDLIRLGEDFRSKVLVSYGQSIVACIERFDLENVRQILWVFPELIKRFENYKLTGDNKI
jgi:PAS domain S-box-containing protein